MERPAPHRNQPGPSAIARKLLQSIVLLVLILNDNVSVAFSSSSVQTQDTATPGLDAGTPGLVSATPSATDTETPIAASSATAALPSATSIPPDLTPQSFVSDTPLALQPLSGEFVQDEVLIRFRRSAEKAAIDKCLQDTSAYVKSQIEDLAVLVLKVPIGTVAESIASLSACPNTRYVEPNYTLQIADTIPSDAGWGLQYGLINIRAPQAWDLNTGSPAVTIAIVDTGVDLGHPDLAAKIVGGYDFVNNDNTPQDDNGHGTHVAGIAAAVSNNGAGVAGASWGARIMPIKALNAAGSGTFADVAAGITWATDNGAQVINLSLGGASPSAVLQDAVNYAFSKGVTLVAAAGNTGSNFVLYPARYPHVMAVAATDGANTRAGFSNVGPEIALSAPGVSIYSTTPGGGYGYLSGTSMSAPFVSGLAAILRGIPGSSGSPEVITWEMETTALDLGQAGFDDIYGYGLIQMDRAIRLAIPPTATPVPPGNAGSGNGNSPGPQPSRPFYTPTFTPTMLPTWTPTEVLATPTFFTLTPSISETAEISAQSISSKAPGVRARLTSSLGNDWPVGCLGMVLILFGVALFVFLSRRQGRRHLSRQKFRF